MPTYFVLDKEAERQWTVESMDGHRLRVTDPDGSVIELDAIRPESGRLHMLVDGRSVDVGVREEGDSWTIQRRGRDRSFEVLNERRMRMRKAGVNGSGAQGPELLSPMAGKVVAILKQQGDQVEEGETLLVVEAMKMENDLKAHRNGVVGPGRVAVGDAVEIGDVLATIEDEG